MGDFYFGVRCGSRVGFLSVCACVLWVKIGLVFLPLFGGVFLGSVGFGGGFCERNSVISFPEKLEV